MREGPTGRALQLLSLLQTHRMWRGAELAERLKVTQRTVRRDIDRLRDLGYRVDATSGIDGGYRLTTGAYVPPLLLNDDEAVAVTVGLCYAAGDAISAIEDSSLQALAKIERLLPERLRRRVSALQSNVTAMQWAANDDLVDPESLSMVAGACRLGEEIRFGYQRRDGVTGQRLVEPYQFVATGRRWYLVAWNQRRHEWRTFRLDRLSKPRLAGTRFPRPGRFQAATPHVSLHHRSAQHSVNMKRASPSAPRSPS